MVWGCVTYVVCELSLLVSEGLGLCRAPQAGLVQPAQHGAQSAHSLTANDIARLALGDEHVARTSRRNNVAGPCVEKTRPTRQPRSSAPSDPSPRRLSPLRHPGRVHVPASPSEGTSRVSSTSTSLCEKRCSNKEGDCRSFARPLVVEKGQGLRLTFAHAQGAKPVRVRIVRELEINIFVIIGG